MRQRVITAVVALALFLQSFILILAVFQLLY